MEVGLIIWGLECWGPCEVLGSTGGNARVNLAVSHTLSAQTRKGFGERVNQRVPNNACYG